MKHLFRNLFWVFNSQSCLSICIQEVLVIHNMYLSIVTSLTVQCHRCRSMETILFRHQKFLEGQSLVQKVDCVVVNNGHQNIATHVYCYVPWTELIGRACSNTSYVSFDHFDFISCAIDKFHCSFVHCDKFVCLIRNEDSPFNIKHVDTPREVL